MEGRAVLKTRLKGRAFLAVFNPSKVLSGTYQKEKTKEIVRPNCF
jgi:hypothetical protein